MPGRSGRMDRWREGSLSVRNPFSLLAKASVVSCLSALLLLFGFDGLRKDARADPPVQEVTLSQAVERALAARPDLKAEAARVQSARETVGQSRAADYPQLSASFQTLYGNSLFGFFLFPNYNYEDLNLLTVTLTQNLLDFGKTGSQIDQSRWSYRAEEARRRTLWLSTIRDAESDYFTLLADQHQVLADKKVSKTPRSSWPGHDFAMPPERESSWTSPGHGSMSNPPVSPSSGPGIRSGPTQ